jgi:hypothetical protein
MADEDKSVSILIDFIARTQGAEAADKALKELGKDTHEVTEHVHKHNEGAREMHRLFHELNRVVPGLGHALKAALNPEAIGLIALLTIVELVVKGFEKLKEASKEAAEQAKKAAEEQRSLLDAQITEWKSAASAADAYNKSVSDMLDEIVKKRQAQAEAIEREAEALKTIAQITGKSKEDQEKIEAAKKAALAIAAKEQLGLDKSEAAFQKGLLDKAEIETPKRIETINKDIGELKKNLEEFPIDKFPSQKIVPQSIAALEMEKERLSRNLEEMRRAQTGRVKGIATQEATLPGLEFSAAQAGLTSNPLSGVVAKGAEALQALHEHGGRIRELSQAQLFAIQQLTAFLDSIHQNSQSVITAIAKAAGNVSALNTQVQKLQAQLDNFTRQAPH